MENGERARPEAQGLMDAGKYAPGDAARAKRHVPQRYVFAVLGAIGMAITYGLKVNFHVCIVTMINHTAVHQMSNASGHAAALSAHGECSPSEGNDTAQSSNLEDGPFEWDAIVQGVLLASYFYGYLVTQVLGGRLAELFSAKWTFGISVLVNVALALLTPPAAWAGWPYLLTVRILQGMAGGVTLPATHVLLSRWSPVSERSRISSLVYAGMSLGTVISVSFTGLLAAVLDWQMVFYIQGGMSMVFVVLWFVLVYDSPAKHPWISPTEALLIVGEKEDTDSQGPAPPLPWKKILKSLPFWAIMISHTGSNFGWYMILTELPTYMSTILGFDIASNALLSAVPFLVMWIYSIMLGNLLDHLGAKGIISRTTSTKIATSIAAFVPALCLVLVTYVGCEKALAVFLLTVATGAIGSMYSGFLSNHISIAPPFAGTLMAITNTAATVPGVLVPSFVGALIHEENTITQWRIIFFTTAGLFVAHGLQYLVLASGEEQEWSKEARRRADRPPRPPSPH